MCSQQFTSECNHTVGLALSYFHPFILNLPNLFIIEYFVHHIGLCSITLCSIINWVLLHFNRFLHYLIFSSVVNISADIIQWVRL